MVVHLLARVQEILGLILTTLGLFQENQPFKKEIPCRRALNAN